MQIPTALQSNPSHLFKHIRFATYGGEPKEAHGIPTFATYGGEGSEPLVANRIPLGRYLW